MNNDDIYSWYALIYVGLSDIQRIIQGNSPHLSPGLIHLSSLWILRRSSI